MTKLDWKRLTDLWRWFRVFLTLAVGFHDGLAGFFLMLAMWVVIDAVVIFCEVADR